MLDAILRHFPAHTHPLTLVADPDGLLADEAVWAALAGRGFRLLAEPDPVRLRYGYEQAKPITAEQPLILVVRTPLNAAPYDIWQRSQPVELALHRFFPHLDYPTLRTLSAAQRTRLATAIQRTPVAAPLGVNATRRYLLAEVFDCEPTALRTPAALALWLVAYHEGNDPMPAALAEQLVQTLANQPVFAQWPLADLLGSAEALRAFVQSAWQGAVDGLLHETPVPYTVSSLDFAADPQLQDALPTLLRSGLLAPIAIERAAQLPRWSSPAVSYDVTAGQVQQFSAGLVAVTERLAATPFRWPDWQTLAWRWAQTTLLRYQLRSTLMADHNQQFQATQAALEVAFSAWLRTAYPALAGDRLPEPHHLFHVAGFLATQRNRHPRLALLILDGMSLAAWLQIRGVWQARQPDWRLKERLVLAQAPSITAIARQALVSGLPPLSFAASLTHNRREREQWRQFWETQGLPAAAAVYEALTPRTGAGHPASATHPRTLALCYVSPVVDEMVHGATQGVNDVHASLELWLMDATQSSHSAQWLEGLIQLLLEQHYLVAVTSDHGHVAAVGMGQPQEGVLVESRSRRARIYDQEEFAQNVQQAYPDTVLWHDDGLLPADRWVLLPSGLQAFAPPGQQVVSHGGLTLEEMIVPLVTIERRSTHA